LLFRRLAAGLVLAALTLGTSACSITPNVASLQMYAPSDGQQVDLESIKARNFIYLVSDSGKGYLIGSLVNSSQEDRIVKMQYQDAQSGLTDLYFEVAAGEKLDFGYNGNEAIAVDIAGAPGQTTLIYVLESDLISGQMNVPILDGTLSEYRMLLEQLEAAN
jgi:hypothetical protein